MVSFFSLLFWNRGENRAKLKKKINLNSTLKWGEHNTLDAQNTFIIFLSAIAVIQVIFWTEDYFCFISGCGNSFSCKLKKLINKQIIIFYGPSNTLCLSDKSLQIKRFKHHTFIDMVSLLTWFNLQILNFC